MSPSIVYRRKKLKVCGCCERMEKGKIDGKEGTEKVNK